MTIEKQTATVWYAPTARRRYLRKHNAISAEARAIIYNRYPVENFEHDTGHYFDIQFHDEYRYKKMHRRLSRMIRSAME